MAKQSFLSNLLGGMKQTYGAGASQFNQQKAIETKENNRIARDESEYRIKKEEERLEQAKIEGIDKKDNTIISRLVAGNQSRNEKFNDLQSLSKSGRKTWGFVDESLNPKTRYTNIGGEYYKFDEKGEIITDPVIKKDEVIKDPKISAKKFGKNPESGKYGWDFTFPDGTTEFYEGNVEPTTKTKDDNPKSLSDYSDVGFNKLIGSHSKSLNTLDAYKEDYKKIYLPEDKVAVRDKTNRLAFNEEQMVRAKMPEDVESLVKTHENKLRELAKKEGISSELYSAKYQDAIREQFKTNNVLARQNKEITLRQLRHLNLWANLKYGYIVTDGYIKKLESQGTNTPDKPAESGFVNGETYTDANGNSAIYQNGKWKEIK